MSIICKGISLAETMLFSFSLVSFGWSRLKAVGGFFESSYLVGELIVRFCRLLIVAIRFDF